MPRPPTLLLAMGGVAIVAAVLVAVADSSGPGQTGSGTSPIASAQAGLPSASPGAVPELLWPAPPDPM